MKEEENDIKWDEESVIFVDPRLLNPTDEEKIITDKNDWLLKKWNWFFRLSKNVKTGTIWMSTMAAFLVTSLFILAFAIFASSKF